MFGRNNSFTLTLWTGPFTDFFVRNANSVDPDQTPRSAASDLGLHCLPMSLL